MTLVYVASAFSIKHTGGNKAGVVFEKKLSTHEKMRIAKELGFSETAFVNHSNQADFKVEYFTSTAEVPLCGHATIGVFSVLHTLGKIEKQLYTIETKAGILSIRIDSDGLIFIEQNKPIFYEQLEIKELDQCIDTEAVSRDMPIQIVSTGLKDILIPIKSFKYLSSLSPNFDKIKELSANKDVIGIHAFTLDVQDGITAICRNFAPLYEIEEEAATGTSNCALACYLFKYSKNKVSEYIFEQGYNLNSPSRIIVRIESQNNEINSVFVGGYGYLVEKRELMIEKA